MAKSLKTRHNPLHSSVHWIISFLKMRLSAFPSILSNSVQHIPVDKHSQQSPGTAQDRPRQHVPWVVRPYIHACDAHQQGNGVQQNHHPERWRGNARPSASP